MMSEQQPPPEGSSENAPQQPPADGPPPPPNYQQQYGQQQYGQHQAGQHQAGQQPGPQAFPQQPAAQSYGAAPVYAGQPQLGPIGKARSSGLALLLLLVTCGFYSIYYFYVTHEEMKKHRGDGLGGPVAALLAFFVGVVSPFILSNEVEKLYTASGREAPVTTMTALWYLPGMFIIVGPFIWFFKTNGALNDYWVSLGAQPA